MSELELKLLLLITLLFMLSASFVLMSLNAEQVPSEQHLQLPPLRPPPPSPPPDRRQTPARLSIELQTSPRRGSFGDASSYQREITRVQGRCQRGGQAFYREGAFQEFREVSGVER